MDLYNETYKHKFPIDHIRTIAESESGSEIKQIIRPKFGLDSLLGLFASSFAAPLYLYASLKGKFQVWDEILKNIPDSTFKGPSLDVGCGRGMVLLKIAQRKKLIAGSDHISSTEIRPAYGIDIFRTEDQTGNSPIATYQNAAAMEVINNVVLHTLSFTERLPFIDGAFQLITSNLALHNANREGRITAIEEMARVCAHGGRIVIVDLYGSFNDYDAVLKRLGWDGVRVSTIGIKMLFGIWPCQMLIAMKSES